MWQKNRRDNRHRPKKRMIEIYTNRHHWCLVELIGNSSNGGLILKLPSGEIITRRSGRTRLYKTRRVFRKYTYEETQRSLSKKQEKKRIGRRKKKSTKPIPKWKMKKDVRK